MQKAIGEYTHVCHFEEKVLYGIIVCPPLVVACVGAKRRIHVIYRPTID
jgi:hypothetical protein